MLLSEFNQANVSEIQTLLLNCVHIDRWATEIAEKRVYESPQVLLKTAENIAKTWTWDEILAALNTHPRIGEKKAKIELSSKEQAYSDQEQAALNPDEETLEAIYKGNIAYEKKYGHIFLIKAAGLNSHDILTALNYRLVNDPDIEKRIVHQQLLEIALLRLSQEVQA